MTAKDDRGRGRITGQTAGTDRHTVKFLHLPIRE